MEKRSIEKLKAFATGQGWRFRPGKEIPYGQQLIIYSASDEVRANYWPKNAKFQVQGKEGLLKQSIEAWISGDYSEKMSQSIAQSTSAQFTSSTPIRAFIPSGAHVGMDESGKGDWFGAIVVAAVYVDSAMSVKLQAAGVCDSKKLGRQQIEIVAGEICRLVPEQSRVVYVANPLEYNQLYQQYQNLNTLLAALYAKTASMLCQRGRQEFGQPEILCDQFAANQAVLNQAFAAQQLPPPYQQHRAEDVSIAVAAASILARSAFVQSLQELGEELGLTIPSGASDVANLTRVARKIIQERGDAIGQFAKLNFAPVKRLLLKS